MCKDRRESDVSAFLSLAGVFTAIHFSDSVARQSCAIKDIKDIMLLHGLLESRFNQISWHRRITTVSYDVQTAYLVS